MFTKYRIQLFFIIILIFQIKCVSVNRLILQNKVEKYRKERREYYFFNGKEEISQMNPIIYGKLGDYLLDINDFVMKAILYSEDNDSSHLTKDLSINQNKFDHVSFFYYLNKLRKYSFNVPYAKFEYITFFSLPIEKYNLSATKFEKSLYFSIAMYDTIKNKLTILDNKFKIIEGKGGKWHITTFDTTDRLNSLYGRWAKSKEMYFRRYCNKKLNSDLSEYDAFQNQQDSTEMLSKIDHYWKQYRKNREKGNLVKCAISLISLSYLEPSNGEIHELLGKLFIGMDDSEEAILALNQALELNYNLGETYYQLAKAFFMRKWFDLSIDYFNKSIQINNAELSSKIYIIKIYFYLGFMEIAQTRLNELFQNYSNKAEVYYTQSLLNYSVGNNEMAINNIKKAIEQNPNEDNYNEFLNFIMEENYVQ